MSNGKAIKIALKDANTVKGFLMKRNLLDFTRRLKKTNDAIYFPITDSNVGITDFEFEVCEEELAEIKRRPKFDDLLKSFLSEDELSRVKKAYDVVGDIAIVEIDEELRSKETLIADALLQSDPNVTTVLRKAGSHSGTFRTQDMAYLAGEEKKDTIHKENGVALKMNVENVYFSARLSTERKRISNLVKDGEEVLVMFSGAAPYPNVLAKNTNAKYIWGIEINPDGFRYGIENLRMNKLNNVFLMNDDVRNAVPKLYQKMIGLKSAVAPEEIKLKADLHPDLFELHTFNSDFEGSGFEDLKKTIIDLQSKGIQVVVHQPMPDAPRLDVVRYNIRHPTFARMVSLVDEFGVDLIIHISHDVPSEEINFDSVSGNVKSFVKYYDKIYFENAGINFFSRLDDFVRLFKVTGLKNMCVDTCHLLYHYSPEEISGVIKEIQNHVNTYFHLSDLIKDNGVPPEQDPDHGGKLDDNSRLPILDILPLVTKGIVEIKDDDYVKSPNMISSWNYLLNFQKTFDRILMPLPKSAEEFLPDALKCVKSGTIIHLYDFLHEDQFKIAHEKIDIACKVAGKKYELIETVKCGQHAPHVYRICVDFKIL